MSVRFAAACQGELSRMLVRSRVISLLAPVAFALLASLATGCGGDGSSHVSGKVTFKGQPVPAGKVYITPDGSKGNKGQAGFADIKDGIYDTSKPGGRGAAPGPVTFAVEGFDPNPPAGAAPDVTTTLLFARYEMKAELPESNFVQDIDVPESAANPPASQPESAGITP
jgi:hypothetical protein